MQGILGEVGELAGCCHNGRAAPKRVAVGSGVAAARALDRDSWQISRACVPACAVTPIELAIYASEMKLLLIGLASLAAIFFAAALLFAFFFGTVNPRLRRADRRSKRLKAETDSLRAAQKGLKTDLANGAARIVTLENANALLEKEVQRLHGIRKRTDSSLLETKALLERMQSVTAHVDMP
jgi:gas vesicle protein